MSIIPKDTDEDTDTYGMIEGFPVSRYGKRWCFRADVQVDGRRKQIRRSFDTSALAIAGYIKFTEDQETYLQRESAETVTELLEWWLGILKDEGRKTTTIDGHRVLQRLYTLPKLGTKRIDKLNADDARGLYRAMADKGLSTSTILAVHRGLKAMINRAVNEDKLKKNVLDKVLPPKGKAARPHIILSPEQVDQFLEAAKNDRLAACWYLVTNTGMRRGELAGLTWNQIDFQRQTIYIDRQRTTAMISGVVESSVKTESSERTIRLPDVVFDFIRDWKVRQTTERMALRGLWHGGDYVFTNADGGPYDPSTFNKRFKLVLKRAGLPTMPIHHMRHTFITNALRAHVDTSNVAPYVGHKHGGITAKLYHKVDPEMSFEMLQPAFQRLAGPTQ